MSVAKQKKWNQIKIYILYGIIWTSVAIVEWMIVRQIGTDHFYALLIAPFIGMFATDAIRINEQEKKT
jgi:hypothetical protein